MRVVLAGAGSVGRTIAAELAANGHQVLVIERDKAAAQSRRLEQAEWLHADACELTALHEAQLGTADVVVAATGDDKANLVVSFLAKSEFAVPRTIARVNNPHNEWMFDDTWGVDVAVSMPSLMTALVEEAVGVGDLVHMFRFQHGGAVLAEFTVPPASGLVGTRVDAVVWPPETVLVGIIRKGIPAAPRPEDVLAPDDELLMLSTIGDDEALRKALLVRNKA